MPPRLYSRPFVLLCLSSLLFSASFQMIIPELPEHLSSMGGAKYIGYIIALFTITAGISRPFSGKLTDTVGRVPVMVIGSLVCVLCGLAYPFVATVWGFLLLRLLHGFSTGFKPTGTAAYAADLSPSERRGEAMSAIGIFSSIGMSAAPPFGSWIAGRWGLNPMFYLSALLALLSVLILVGALHETLPDKQPFRLRHLRISRRDVYAPSALAPAIVMALLSFLYGAIITLTPDMSIRVGLENKGIFLAVSTLAALLVRLVAARISDRRGRVWVMRICALGLALNMGLIALAGDAFTFLLAGFIHGFVGGLASPTLQAWTIDRCDAAERGRALATLYIGLELGIGLGAWASGSIYAGHPERLAWPFWIGAALALTAFLYLWRRNDAFSPAPLHRGGA